MSEHLSPDDLWVEEDAFQERLRRDRLMAHPHCMDPAHPGCASCEPEDTPTVENCDDWGTGEGRFHGRM